MSTLRERIESRIRAEICPLCRQARPEGRCAHSAEQPCPLIERLDDVMDLVSGIRDYSLEPYQEKLREIVCSTCRADESGACDRRDRNSCPLDSHFPKVVAIIEAEMAADPGLV